jgi:hypothetical protein
MWSSFRPLVRRVCLFVDLPGDVIPFCETADTITVTDIVEQKLIVAQLVGKFFTFLLDPKVHYLVNKRPLGGPF